MSFRHFYLFGPVLSEAASLRDMSVSCFRIFIISLCFLLRSVSSGYLLLCKRPHETLWLEATFIFCLSGIVSGGQGFRKTEWVCLRLQSIARGAAGAGGPEEGPLGSCG